MSPHPTTIITIVAHLNADAETLLGFLSVHLCSIKFNSVPPATVVLAQMIPHRNSVHEIQKKSLAQGAV